MAGGITYDNVKTEDGGDIFQGMSFWVAQRVPARNSILKAIEDNGGTVVKLEAKADMLIADHALRKDAPLASYSWKYIAESVKNGISQVPDKYRIHPDPEDARPVNGPGPKKGGRTPYTKTDDAQLAAWVLNHTGGREGNEIYKELERNDPRHPWQSWRDRWVKQLRPLPMHELETLAQNWYSLGISRPGMENPKPGPGGQGGQRMGEGNQAATGPVTAKVMRMNNPPPDPEARAKLAAQARAASTAANKTQQQQREDAANQRRLQELQKAALTAQSKMQLQQAALAPQNKMQQQKAAAAVKYLASKNNAEEEEDSDSEEDDFEQAAAPRHLRSTPPRPTDSQPSKGKAIATQLPLSFEEEDEDSESEQIRQQALLAKVNKTLSKSLAGSAVNAPSQSKTQRGAIASQVPGATGPVDEEASDVDAEEDNASGDGEDSASSGSVGDENEEQDPETGVKAARFYKDLLAFDNVKAEDFQDGLLKGPNGALYEMSLYDLCEAAILFHDPAAGIDWDKVAERLEMDEHDWVPAALEVCYNERLKDFHEEVINSESQAVNDDGVEAQIRQQLESEAELPSMSNQVVEDDRSEEEIGDEMRVGSEAEEETACPATQDLTPRPQKRKIERVESTASVRKRRRESEGAEIQSTPDTVVKRAEQQRQQQLYDLDEIEESQEPRQRPVKRRLRNQIEYGVPEPRRSTRATRSRTYESVEPEPRPTAKQGSSAAAGRNGNGKAEVIEIPDTYEEDDDLGTGPVTQPVTQLPADMMGGVHDSDDVFMDMDGEPVQGTDDGEEEFPTPKPKKATKRSKLPFGQSSGNGQPRNPAVPQSNVRPSASPSEFWTPSPLGPTRDPLKEGVRSSVDMLKKHGENNFQSIPELKKFLTETLGYNSLATEEAVHRVTAFPGEALIECVHALQKGEPIPNYQGIWTDEDDKWLSELTDYDWERKPESQAEWKERKYRRKQRDRLRKKHLREGMEHRLHYLSSNTCTAYKENKRAREEAEMRRRGARDSTVSTARWAAFQAH